MNNLSQAIQQKNKILVRLIQAFDSDDYAEQIRLIPYELCPQNSLPNNKCCIYKEREIIRQTLVSSLGFKIENDEESRLLSDYAKESLETRAVKADSLTISQTACKGCPGNKIYVTDLCQGCVARPCEKSCKFGAISKTKTGVSVIDVDKCKKCRQCIEACPYSAIVRRIVPCEETCPVGAIKKDDMGYASIDFEKCISCGRCISACPFGAVNLQSQIIDVLKCMKEGKKLVALLAPAVAGQFPYSIGQLKSALIQVGFSEVLEVAYGADITTKTEALEFTERMQHGDKFMTTSCCAGYRQLLKKHLAEMQPFVSETETPMHYIAEYAKQLSEDYITVFISPCSAKRTEGYEDPFVDFVIGCDEMGALLVARKIQIAACEETVFDKKSSKQGRNFANTGGVSTAVKSLLAEDTNCKEYIINGLSKENIAKLRKFAKTGVCDDDCNLVEVMCCDGGCVGGNATLNNMRPAAKLVKSYSEDGENLAQ